MKRILSILALMALAIGITANAQSDTRYAYVKKSNVNIRATASPNGKVVDKAQEGNVYWAKSDKGNWVEICYNVFDEEMGYISKSMVEVVESHPFPKDKLNSMFYIDGNGVVGSLSFTQDGDKVKYDYILKDKALVQAGGSGIIERGDGETGYIEDTGMLFQPSTWFLGREDPNGISQAIYDPSTGQLIFGGILWTEVK